MIMQLPIIKNIVSFFTGPSGALIAIMLAIAAMIFIPNSSAVLEKLGFETRASLKADKARLETTVDTAVNANQNNQVVQATKEAVDQISYDAASKVDTYIEKRDTAVSQATTKHQQSITAAKSSLSVKKDHPPIPPAAVIESTSQANIQLLWDTYETINTTKRT